MVCSSSDLFLNEVENLKKMFWNNGYSFSFFQKVFLSFNNRNSANENIDVDSGKYYFVKIPYIGPSSHDFKNQIIKLFSNYLLTNVTPVFNTFKVSNYFSLKSQTPKILKSNVVYKFTCLCDANLTYIGKTKRHLVVRSLEHLKFENAEPKSTIKDHLKSDWFTERLILTILKL